MSVVIDQWTGRTATLLQDALRMTNEAFAEHLGVAVRTVAAWRMGPHITPRPEMQRILDTAYERADGTARFRFSRNFAPIELPAPAAVMPNVAVEVAVLQTRMEQLQTQLDQLASVQREMTLLRVRMEQLAKLAETVGVPS